MAERLLVVEDDDGIRDLLHDYLEGYGFEVTTVADGAGMRAARQCRSYDLLLLDLGLPGDDGLTLAREVRATSAMGIIIITGRGEPIDRIIGLEIGADDYVAKPFDLRELLARIRSVLRRVKAVQEPLHPAPAEILVFDGWQIDLASRSLCRPDGEAVPLTSGEFELLAIFARSANRVLSRDELMDAIHRREASPYDRSIDVQVGRLRRKIENDPARPERIKSVRGVGYLFTCRVSPEAQATASRTS